MAVRDLDLEVASGDLYGFLGPNGAGKTTTMRCILGLIRTHGGEVEIFGQRHPVRRRRGVGAMVETPVFHPWLGGRANLRIAAMYNGMAPSEAGVDEALERVGLAGRGGDRVSSYSHGMRQRLGIARALLGRPRLVLLDEPTVGLDPRGMREVRDLLRELVQRDGLTVFLSSHLLSEVEAICNRVGILDEGIRVAEGPVEELLAGLRGVEELEVGAVDSRRLSSHLEEMEGVEVVGAGEAGRIRVRLASGVRADLNRRLVEAGVAVTALVPRQRRLEDLYLEATHREESP